ncbi:MAG: hypothetical protein K6F68_03340 [Clostridiales bacterium]|nr:hypothetical protein [Clostridiales bacterium]
MKDSFFKCLITALITAAACLIIYSFAFCTVMKFIKKPKESSETEKIGTSKPEKSLQAEDYSDIDAGELRPIRSIIDFIATGETRYFLDAMDPGQRIDLPDASEINLISELKENTAELIRSKVMSMLSGEITGIDYELISSKDVSGGDDSERELEIRITVETNKETHEFIITPRVRFRDGRWYLKIPELTDLIPFKQAA